jgi:hypothetical protein
MTIYQKYEMLKQEWILKNPSATYKEYQAAIIDIAWKVGV